MAEQLRTIKLYGKLGATFGREFKLSVKSPAEAVSALCNMIPGFEAYLTKSKDNGMDFAVFVGKRNLAASELGGLVEPGDIRIAPVTRGHKNGSLVQIIVGIVLIIIGGLITGWSFGTAAPFGTAIAMMGVAMIVGGIVQMLMPKPKGAQGQGDRPEDQPNYAFNGPLNTQAQGHPVPLLYGRLITGSAVISAGISMDDTSTGNTTTETGAPGAWTGGSINNFVKWAVVSGS